ncbi:MAG: ACP S-malonyltransferase [Alphaproteobacteria bacterium]|nr:ACP S-malonyltransferase [Alphaproteobacteria bacterium]MYE58664.1 ACP S-malonyltransferase [Alphaproteobacteria bacterium]
MARAFVFPGQGSQAVGMGSALAEASPAAREVFEEVDDALGQSLSRLMFEGPGDELTLTENAQPALMAHSMAVFRVLEREGGVSLPASCLYLAGHSLGEYSALTAAGSFRLADTARLLKLRGQAMQGAVPVGAGAMAALLGLDFEQVAEVARDAAEGDVCDPANDNAPGQVVVSGDRAAVERAVALAKARGARRAILLDVSAPFHCSLLQPAADAMAEVLDAVDMQDPSVPLVANVTAQPVESAAGLQHLLVRQVTATVRWRESMMFMRDNDVDRVVELGTGKVLSGLVRRIDREMSGVAVEGPDDIEALLKEL